MGPARTLGGPKRLYRGPVRFCREPVGFLEGCASHECSIIGT